MRQAVYCFEHPPSRTLCRAGAHELQIFRDQELTRTVRVKGMVSSSSAGKVAFRDPYDSQDKVIDLTVSSDPEPAILPEGAGILHPAGEYLFSVSHREYPYEEPISGRTVAGLLKVAIDSGEVVWRCAGEGVARQIHPLGEEAEKSPFSLREPKAPEQPITDTFPQLVLAPEGETWALVGSHRVAIGQGADLKADVWWKNPAFSPANGFFDPKTDQFYLSGHDGILCLSLEGEVISRWDGRLPCEPYENRFGRRATSRAVGAASPVIRRDEDLLAIVPLPRQGNRVTGGKPCWYEVHRFDPETLVPRGPLDGMTRRRLSTEWGCLFSLADGSLAWGPAEEPLLILPTESCERRTTEWIQIVGDEPPPRVPHPEDDPDYDVTIGTEGSLEDLSSATPGQRRSLVRYLLQELQSDPRFEQLLLLDPDSFRPYANSILGWSEDSHGQLENVDFDTFWWVAQGASDEAVEKLASALEKSLGEGLDTGHDGGPRLTEIQRIRTMLLLGVLSDRSLERLGELGREYRAVAELASEHQVAVPKEGPAQLRFSPGSLEVVAEPATGRGRPQHSTGVLYGPEFNQLFSLERSLTCLRSPEHVLSAKVSWLPGDPLAGSALPVQHWFFPSCSQCDDNLEDRIDFLVDSASEKIELRGHFHKAESCCPGDGEEADFPKVHLRIAPYSPEQESTNRHLGRLGGRVSYRSAHCPTCGELQFYVGWMHASAVRSDLPYVTLYGFQCERCGIGTLLVEMT
ncbi:MAG: hypothetical protein AAF604_04200 [Acidobacteriota bacterium]